MTQSKSKEQSKEFVDVISDSALRLSICEVSIGTLVHAFKIPFGGHALSLNQGLFLIFACRRLEGIHGQAKSPTYISGISALMKSLSPAGNRLGPMLSISMQGIIFYISALPFAFNKIGLVLGFILMGLWAFLQPFITVMIFLGQDFIQAFTHYVRKIGMMLEFSSETMWLVIAIPVIVKMVVSLGLGIWAVQTNALIASKKFQFFLGRLTQKSPHIRSPKNQQDKSKWRLILKDMTRPIFLVSFLLTFTYLFFNTSELASVIWKGLRPLAVAFVFFYIVRSNYIEKWLKVFFQKNPNSPFYKIFRTVNYEFNKIF